MTGDHDFWSAVVQIMAVFTLAIVLEVRGLRRRVARSAWSRRTKWWLSRLVVFAAFFVAAVVGDVFRRGLSVLAGIEPTGDSTYAITVVIGLFTLVVAAPAAIALTDLMSDSDVPAEPEKPRD